MNQAKTNISKQLAAYLLVPVLFPLYSFSQTDIFPGSWQMQSAAGQFQTTVELKIGNPEKSLLYPAQLKISCDKFNGTYYLLLVKKSRISLGISKNKKPVSEQPFSIGSWSTSFNNILNYTKTNSGSYLQLIRLPLPRNAITDDLATFSATDMEIAKALKGFLLNGDINLKKIDPFPWKDEHVNDILGNNNDYYFGITDTVHVMTGTLKIWIPDNKKNDNDTASVMINGESVIDQADIRKKNGSHETELQHGLNIVTFFADNYGKYSGNGARLNLQSGKKKIQIDFSKNKDLYATCLVTKIYYLPGNEDSLEYVRNESDRIAEKTLHRSARQVGQLETRSQQITLAIWDDAIEDGDSISLNINGKWLVRGFAVKKQTQFIPVTLEPGPNQIIFIADNLGSIIPNTSVLEIIDGKQRRSFKIETNYNKNNLINIFYDFNPER